MKRHPALEPFSRDHNDGLILARSLMTGETDAPRLAQAAWDGELRDHFKEEERLLGPLLSETSLETLLREHREIEAMIESLPEGSAALGEALEAHIRWEERVLFPEIETTATEEDFKRLDRESQALEERRWPNSPRRAELVQRRHKPTST